MNIPRELSKAVSDSILNNMLKLWQQNVLLIKFCYIRSIGRQLGTLLAMYLYQSNASVNKFQEKRIYFQSAWCKFMKIKKNRACANKIIDESSVLDSTEGGTEILVRKSSSSAKDI